MQTTAGHSKDTLPDLGRRRSPRMVKVLIEESREQSLQNGLKCNYYRFSTVYLSKITQHVTRSPKEKTGYPFTAKTVEKKSNTDLEGETCRCVSSPRDFSIISVIFPDNCWPFPLTKWVVPWTSQPRGRRTPRGHRRPVVVLGPRAMRINN